VQTPEPIYDVNAFVNIGATQAATVASFAGCSAFAAWRNNVALAIRIGDYIDQYRPMPGEIGCKYFCFCDVCCVLCVYV
jgi:hypothetical protein